MSRTPKLLSLQLEKAKAIDRQYWSPDRSRTDGQTHTLQRSVQQPVHSNALGPDAHVSLFFLRRHLTSRLPFSPPAPSYTCPHSACAARAAAPQQPRSVGHPPCHPPCRPLCRLLCLPLCRHVTEAAPLGRHGAPLARRPRRRTRPCSHRSAPSPPPHTPGHHLVGVGVRVRVRARVSVSVSLTRTLTPARTRTQPEPEPEPEPEPNPNPNRTRTRTEPEPEP